MVKSYAKVVLVSLATLLFSYATLAARGDELERRSYLREPLDPYYVHQDFPKLTTPQWVGEPGVECVVTLAIDDMRDPAVYERFLRPVLDRLKQIDGRAPISIMTNNVPADNPQLAAWLQQGLSIEVHTVDHPCPCLHDGSFEKAKSTYDRCVDLMNQIPGNRPVAFRMPCCDSLNTPSPRFWRHAFDSTTPQGNFLQIDSSVFNVVTPKDRTLPREWVLDSQGKERFRRYIPFPAFVNTIEDYPYPYLIGGTCWEFPCVVPSDWSAQHVQRSNNPDTVRDWKIALDATVLKQGTFNLVYHPHGWIRAEQLLELIDHAVERYGSRVKFLTFKECADRLNSHLLDGHPVRDGQGQRSSTRIVDLNDDGYLDVVYRGDSGQIVRKLWNAQSAAWSLETGTDWPVGIDSPTATEWWRDIDGDGRSEHIQIENDVSRVFSSDGNGGWRELPFTMPPETTRIDPNGGRAELRFIDVNSDGKLDILFSNAKNYSLHLFRDLQTGWSIRAIEGVRGKAGTGPVIPPLIRADGTNNGAWFHSRRLWIQNEDTNRLPDHVDRLAFDDMLQPLRDSEIKTAMTPMLIGAASVDITPDYPVRLSGYGNRRQESSTVAQRLTAKALAIGGPDAESPAILITVENCGMTPTLREAVVFALREQRISPERVVICATHSHTAPCISGWAQNLFGEDLPPDHKLHVERYTQELTAKLIQVARQAISSQRPGRLAWGQGSTAIAANRRVLKDGRWAGFGVQSDGPVDHSLPVLAARDLSGKLIAVVANYACHCTTLPGEFNEISGDWAGHSQQLLEQDHPGAIALLTIGCGADANPNPRGTLANSIAHGRTVANEVNRVLSGELTPLSPQLDCQLRHIALPLEASANRDEWTRRASLPGVEGHYARKHLQRAAVGEEFPSTVHYPIATWVFGARLPQDGTPRPKQLGDLAMVFLGGEVVVDYVTRMKSEFDASRLWVSAYANDVPGYIPSRRLLTEGGYETDLSIAIYDLPARFAPEVEDTLIDAVQKLLPHWFYTAAKQADIPPPQSPEESRAAIRVLPGMQVEIVAAEPLVQDPVAFDWGADGSLWVAEMRDYPNGLDWNGPADQKGTPGGRIKHLIDRDGDGRYDEATVFLDQIPFPTGVKVWRKGVIISGAPRVFYAEDTDGDGRADRQELLLEGFQEGNQQHRVNGLRWGLDNWLHLANGDSGGLIRSEKTKVELGINGRDLRFRPDTGELDAQAGQTQFGRNRDDWGNWFGGNNANPMWHYVLEDHYSRRNPHVALIDHRNHVSIQPGASPVFPISRTLARFNDFNMSNRFTSACSPEIYRDNFLGLATPADPLAAQVFICEPVHNLVHREIMTSQGSSFTSQRAEEEARSEFLASSDNWFRPVMARTGPDGGLWIADMYRAVIEHPEWIPLSWQSKLDLRAGTQLGRIYRVTPNNKPRQPLPRLDQLDLPGLVAAMDSVNGWQRDMVQQMLVWREDIGARKPLEELFRRSQIPQARMQALCTLDGLRQLDPSLLVSALRDDHPGVRRQAVRLAESVNYAKLNDAKLNDAVLQAVTDDHPSVKLQLALSAGSMQERGGRILAGLIRGEIDDPYLQAAIVSSLNESNLESVLKELFASRNAQATQPLLEAALTTTAALGKADQLSRAVQLLTAVPNSRVEPWQLNTLATLVDSLQRNQGRLSMKLTPEARDSFATVVSMARKLAAEESTDNELRCSAARLLGREPEHFGDDLSILQKLLAPQATLEMQLAAVNAIARSQSEEVPRALLRDWPAHGPVVRNLILDLLLGREEWCGQLLTAIEEGQIARNQFDARRRQQLAVHKNESLRNRALSLFESSTEISRQQLVASYLEKSEEGNVEQGKTIFAKRCSACHRLEGQGHAVGPDLAASANKPRESLLISILDPNRAIEDRYMEFQVFADDGRSLTGMISAETGTSITLLGQEGKTTTLLRNQIETLRSTGKSLMPEGLEKDLSPQDANDLISYLRRHAAPPKQFAGNQPAVVKPEDDGAIKLLATNARIYGPTLVFEDQYRNLGFWQSADDLAVWTLEVARGGKYRCVIDYAAQADAAGDRFVIVSGNSTIGGVVQSTEDWDQYRTLEVGVLSLQIGTNELQFRSAGPIKSAMIDLRGIRLYPIK